jgi:hypothetical protein
LTRREIYIFRLSSYKNSGHKLIGGVQFLKTLGILFGLLIIMISTGCATIMNPKMKEVAFNSKPKGMTVLINDEFCGKTPLSVELSKKLSYDIKYKYNDSIVFKDSLKSKANFNYILMDLLFPTNIFLFTIPLPFLVDGISGSFLELNKSYLYYNTLKNDLIYEVKTNRDASRRIKNTYNQPSSQGYKNYVLRYNSYNWSLNLNNSYKFENLKLINIDNNMLEVIPANLTEKDSKIFKSFNNSKSVNFRIPVDSINSLIFREEMKTHDRLKNSFVGLLFGGCTGFAIGYITSSKSSDGNFYLALLSTALGGLAGIITGALSSTGDYGLYNLKNMNTEERIKLINKEILLDDE